MSDATDEKEEYVMPSTGTAIVRCPLCSSPLVPHVTVVAPTDALGNHSRVSFLCGCTTPKLPTFRNNVFLPFARRKVL